MVTRAMLEQGAYEIDPQRVADAILDRILGHALLIPWAAEPQNECSKPSSAPAASTNSAAASPSVT